MYWFDLIRQRQPEHVYPTTFSQWRYLKLLIVASIFFLSVRHAPNKEHSIVIKLAVLAMTLLWLVGTIFSEIYPVAVVVQLQFFRSYVLFTLFAMLYFSNYFITQMYSSKTEWYHKLFMVALLILFTFTPPDWHNRNYYFVLIGVLLFSYIYLFNQTPSTGYFIAVCLGCMVVLFNQNYIKRGGFAIQEPQSLKAQLWAKENTKLDDKFIICPDITGFRIESERYVYAEWKDGQQMYFNPFFGREWERRMRQLGVQNIGEAKSDSKIIKAGYNNLSEDDFIKIANEISGDDYTVFVLTESELKLDFKQVYSNSDYKIYMIGSEK